MRSPLYIAPNWPAPTCIKAYTTTRHGWGHTLADYKNRESTQSLVNLLHLPSDPCWIQQKHTAIATKAALNQSDYIADASFTTETNRVCAVLTADCIPILLCNRDGTEIAAIHAGWRGLANGIINTTLASLQSHPANLLAWLGPAIGPQHFEVGADVYDAFLNKDAKNATAFTPTAQPHQWLANLYTLATLQLQQAQVSHIFSQDFCTYRDADLFYSYRRDQGKTGRLASVIWIDEGLWCK